MWLRVVLVVLLAILVFAAPLFFAFAGHANPNGAGTTGPAVYTPESVALLARESGIPVPALGAYLSAGTAYPDVGWTVLAGIGRMECNHGRSTLPGCARPTANRCGARGPMQFLGNTWRRGTDPVASGMCPGTEAFTGNPIGPPVAPCGAGPRESGPGRCREEGYATDGNGDGTADPWEWLDATHAAARYLRRNGYENNSRSALHAYNDSPTYVEGVERWAAQYAAVEARLLEEGRLVRSPVRPAGLGCPAPPRGPVDPATDPHITPATTMMASAVLACFGRPHALYCFDRRDGEHEHPRGRACDFMATSGDGAQGEERQWGQLLAEWVAANAESLNVSYVIWWDRIWNSSEGFKPWNQWRDYSPCKSPCTNPNVGHFNHVHVSVKLMPGDPGWAQCIPNVPCVV